MLTASSLMDATCALHGGVWLGVFLMPNDPSSATRPTKAFDCNRDATAGFAAAHGSALRSFCYSRPKERVLLEWRASLIGMRGSKASLRLRQMRQPQ